MSRIFISLSLLPIVLIFVTMTVGWWIGDYNEVYQQVLQQQRDGAAPSLAGVDAEASAEDSVPDQLVVMQQQQRRFRIHFQLGLATALVTILINSLSVTYLIGTSRWVLEVTDTYGLPRTHDEQSKRLKRQTFPWSLLGICSILVVVALGAASDPGTLRDSTAAWVLPHSLAAMLGACFIVWAILVQAFNLQRNARIIDDVVREVRDERVRRGWETEEQ